ncbi:NADP-dependent oxidoreductase [Actinospica durhamensis]|uniref:NADP-dependent oxidoreductase n=1 Tax=Actinospica durhamensis TaxID=1508375 RepID=A0A941IPR9_9ACTN|nr:NADP-dependent oxidoreductase [Actinospica durhamensis]MBR7833412.1 NADP-dependent oxidoreductase [Actinospica durhamensis]
MNVKSASTSSDPRTAREVRLVVRSRDLPTTADFRIAEVSLPEPASGQVLVRNHWFAARAVMRALMGEGELPMPRYRPGAALWGPAVGRVVRRGDADGPVPGTWVLHGLGWRDFALVPTGQLEQIAPADVEVAADEDAVTDGPRQDADARDRLLAHLAQGETAYAGLMGAARLRPGDTVFVSSAAGSVGSMAGQIARLKGAGRVIGSAGGPAKVAWLLDELGYDAAFDHRERPVVEQLRRAAPEGIDVYFDNVGGEQLRAALELARPGARFALCGVLGQQGGGELPGLELDTFVVIAKSLRLQGFTARDYPDLSPQYEKELAQWLAESRLVIPAVRYRGLDAAPEALLALLGGRHTGNVIVEL